MTEQEQIRLDSDWGTCCDSPAIEVGNCYLVGEQRLPQYARQCRNCGAEFGPGYRADGEWAWSHAEAHS